MFFVTFVASLFRFAHPATIRATFRGGRCNAMPRASSAASFIDSPIVGCANTVSAKSVTEAFAPIIAPADGIVAHADFMSGYGRMVVIDHGYGIGTRYGHLSSFAVSEGQRVSRGDRLGYVGMSGRSTGAHLHYEVWVRNTPVNPAKYLRNTVASVQRAGLR